jgi:hypothetical protein
MIYREQPSGEVVLHDMLEAAHQVAALPGGEKDRPVAADNAAQTF